MPFNPVKPVRRVRASYAGAGCRWLVLLSAGAAAWAATPHIDHIELLGTNLVTIHFDTDANRTYTLQYLDHLAAGTNTAASDAWSNLTVIPATPFNNHYVLVDNRTNQHRFYRLSVTP
ncbi:MAG TPA: hypothetical protein VJW76_11500 [Verrucomicrobiae bacterium]|nr:hypothetical protein [Verrucomicrobiae bacterium]